MLSDDANQRPTARDLLDDFPTRPTQSLQNPQTNVTWMGFGVSSIASNANGTTMIYSAAPTPMDWTRIGATAFSRGNPQLMQRDESTQPSQLNPVADQLPKAPPNRLA
ncbi:hypothetical protein OIDMADRAFT_149603 [Oidiodendron maius Zn]|uniref:Uncharacterized protein n=1 Tax=Oidiodendron maius (strain Zn) TaxID=913774 RepID=A0A0C3GCN9_OIDMZ|nr:hypothetical protein OIDMADRAFT_149603 [Oidiodendron maius Zn]